MDRPVPLPATPAGVRSGATPAPASRVVPSTPAAEWPVAAPWLAAVLGAAILAIWWWTPVRTPMVERVPGADRPPGETTAGGAVDDVFAKASVSVGPGKAAVELAGSWPRFRGIRMDGRAEEKVALARSWSDGKPRTLWTVAVGEGFAGPVVDGGRVFLMDYDREKQRDALRCLSLADGAEIWRFSYPMTVKRNHGISRTVPSVSGGRVVAMGPKGHVMCVDAGTGRFAWGVDLVKDYGTTVPAWYTGQCPLIEGDAVILAPGGPDVLMVSRDLGSGKEGWRTPNPNGWKMTHASVVPMDLEGRRLLLYPASGGVVAVDARDGSLAWETPRWKINIATVPSPVVLGEGRVFFTGGYSAGSALFRLRVEAGKVVGEEVFRVKADVFGATQHTPVWHEGHLYGIRADGRLVCLSAEGKVVWASGPDTNFGLGPLMVADGLVLAVSDDARLTVADAVAAGYRPHGTAAVLEEGVEAWGPMALAGDRLLVRDLNRMVCLSVGAAR